MRQMHQQCVSWDEAHPELALPCCHQCQMTAIKNIGEVEVELTLLFGGVRGSTSLAEKMSPSEFSTLISRFFAVTSKFCSRATPG